MTTSPTRRGIVEMSGEKHRELLEALDAAAQENEALNQMIYEQNRQISWLLATHGAGGVLPPYSDEVTEKVVKSFQKSRSSLIGRVLWTAVPTLRSVKRILRRRGVK